MPYVVAKYQLAKYAVEKVGKGQRLCNCAHSEFWGPDGQKEGWKSCSDVKFF